MKKNLILILGLACTLTLNACNDTADGSADTVDTAAVVRDFLVSRGIVEDNDLESYAATKGVAPTDVSMQRKITVEALVEALKGPEWKSAGGLVSVAKAKEQVNTYLDLTFRNRLRSFTIDRKVFEDYITQSKDSLAYFKLCIGVARDASGALLKRERSLFVIGVSQEGHLISLPDAGVASYYDQISPCPSVCPTYGTGLSHCDYLDIDAELKPGERCKY